MNISSSKNGLLKLGYVTNLKTSNAELNELLAEESQVNTMKMNALVDVADIVYLNKYGYAKKRSGEAVGHKDAAYLYFETGLVSKTNDAIIGWFEKKGNDPVFKGVTWGTKSALDAKIRVSKMFHWGELFFKNEEEGLAFLEDIAASTIPETWSFKNKPSTVNHPILKSYIENTFDVLKKEAERGAKNKLVYSQDVQLFAHQAPLSMGFSKEEYWSGLPCPSPGNLSDPGIDSRSPALQAESLLNSIIRMSLPRY